HRSSISVLINHPSPTARYTLSLHDALPIYLARRATVQLGRREVHLRGGPTQIPRPHQGRPGGCPRGDRDARPEHGGDALQAALRSEEHTSELQSLRHLVCRLLLEKKKKQNK